MRTIIKSECGPDFDAYVQNIDANFIKSSSGDDEESTSSRTMICTTTTTTTTEDDDSSCSSIWHGRQFRILLSFDSPIWHVGKVKHIEYNESTTLQNNNTNRNASTDSIIMIDLYLTMEFVTKKMKNNKMQKQKQKQDDNNGQMNKNKKNKKKKKSPPTQEEHFVLEIMLK